MFDTDRADDTEFFPHNWDGGAFEFSASDVELVVEFVFVCQLPLFSSQSTNLSCHRANGAQ